MQNTVDHRFQFPDRTVCHPAKHKVQGALCLDSAVDQLCGKTPVQLFQTGPAQRAVQRNGSIAVVLYRIEQYCEVKACNAASLPFTGRFRLSGIPCLSLRTGIFRYILT